MTTGEKTKLKVMEMNTRNVFNSRTMEVFLRETEVFQKRLPENVAVDQYLDLLLFALKGDEEEKFSLTEEMCLILYLREQYPRILNENPCVSPEKLLLLRNVDAYHEKKFLFSNEHDDNHNTVSSYYIFVKYASPVKLREPSRILSKICFDTWVRTRKNGVRQPERSYKKGLVAHLRGKDGRKPFPPVLEQLILDELRKKQLWPCFQSGSKVSKIGMKTFRHLGYHEGLGLAKKTKVNEAPVEKKTRKRALETSIIETPKKSAFDEDLFSIASFSDVSSNEVLLVAALKIEVKPFQKSYVDLVQVQFKASELYLDHLFGELILLRFLRQANHDIPKASVNYKQFLAWRVANRVFLVRNTLVASNPNPRELWNHVTYISYQGTIPFFSKRPNGDYLEVWTMKPAGSDSKYRELYIRDQIILSEYRAMLLDNFSMRNKRVISYSIAYDLNFISDTFGWQSLTDFEEGGFPAVKADNLSLDDAEAIKQGGQTMDILSHAKSWAGDLQVVGEIISKHYGGYCSKFVLLGTGAFYKLYCCGFFIGIFKDFRPGSSESLVCDKPTHMHIAKELLGFNYNELKVYKEHVVATNAVLFEDRMIQI
eukprot:snap_masked-scaffold_7-processed-gene-3.29-mRNA-1 protein AED:0.00 eAED:0.00 QI:345/1/1/1/0.5/0.4/5/269/596